MCQKNKTKQNAKVTNYYHCVTFHSNNVLHFVRGSCYQIWWPMVFPSNLTSGWSWLNLCDLWSQQCNKFWTGVLPTKFGSHRAFPNNLTSGWPSPAASSVNLVLFHYSLFFLWICLPETINFKESPAETLSALSILRYRRKTKWPPKYQILTNITMKIVVS